MGAPTGSRKGAVVRRGLQVVPSPKRQPITEIKIPWQGAKERQRLEIELKVVSRETQHVWDTSIPIASRPITPSQA